MSSLSLKRWWVWLWCEATEHEFSYFYLAKQAKSHSSPWTAQNHTRLKKGHKNTSQDKAHWGYLASSTCGYCLLGLTYHSEVFPDIIWCIFGQWGLIHESEITIVHGGSPWQIGSTPKSFIHKVVNRSHPSSIGRNLFLWLVWQF